MAQIPVQVALTGTGSTTFPAITFSPTSLTFPGQLLTTTSSAMPVVVKNTGTTSLTISKVADRNLGFYRIPIIVPVTTVAPTMTCTIMVTFAPQSSTAPGTVTGRSLRYGQRQRQPPDRWANRYRLGLLGHGRQCKRR